MSCTELDVCDVYTMQVDGYLASKSESVSTLFAFPAVAEAFKKVNSTLPSSAAVERLFSSASQILTTRRCKMSDDTLDKLLFLRSRLKMDTLTPDEL